MSLKPLDKLPENPLTIKRALLSVSDKENLIPLARTLADLGVELVSTGGTAKAIRDAGIDVMDVSEVTGFPECLDGRVKTLHPAIHGGILARTSYKQDLREIEKLDIRPFELIVVNLYPFKETVSRPEVTPAIATENIDIGGPTMLRAAAKNFAHVCVVSSPDQYRALQKELEENGTVSFELRRNLARDAFRHTADYDAAISHYFDDLTGVEGVPEQWTTSLRQSGTLRYGENPHQEAAVYGDQEAFFNCFHGKALSYNNYLDIDAALALMSDFREDPPTVAIFKHTVPCGVASDTGSLEAAWKKAFATDTVSPFGGIVIVNRELDVDTAAAIDEIFTEIILAPSFSERALELLQKKKNRRLIRIKKYPEEHTLQFRSITGGALLQQADNAEMETTSFKTVTERQPGEEEMADLFFAWRVVRHVKSNAIVYARGRQTLGIGTGQTSRVDSSEIAIRKAEKEGLTLEGSVIASDAFFPFADGVEAAAAAGARAVIQPGGSVRDEEVIKTANAHDLAMIFTGKRHFRH